jgi:hypothetical protein
MIFSGAGGMLSRRVVVRLEVEHAVVDLAGVALGAADGHQLAVLQHLRWRCRTDDGRHAQLARDDRRVAGAAAAVGDDGEARFITGSQSGSVMSVTSTSPACTRAMSSSDLTSGPRRRRSSGRPRGPSASTLPSF